MSFEKVIEEIEEMDKKMEKLGFRPAEKLTHEELLKKLKDYKMNPSEFPKIFRYIKVNQVVDAMGKYLRELEEAIGLEMPEFKPFYNAQRLILELASKEKTDEIKKVDETIIRIAELTGVDLTGPLVNCEKCERKDTCKSKNCMP